MQKLKVKNLIISKQGEESIECTKILELAANKKINIIIVSRRQRIKIEKNIYIDILWPNKSGLIKENTLNNNSIVAKFVYKNFSLLFTGDIEKLAENEILKTYTNKEIKANCLKVAHHGSKTSTSDDFLEVVEPKIALIGVGKDNKYKHPSDEIIQRLKKLKCKIYRTDKYGEIMLRTNGKKVEINTFNKK